MERSIILVALLSLLSCHAADAGAAGKLPPTLARARRRVTPAEGDQSGTAPGVPPQVQYETRYYTQRLDHFNAVPASYGTFQQRYLVNDTYWGGKTAPIFLYAGNEGDVDLFTNATGFMWETAPRFRAMLVFIEHRYYGESMPFGSSQAAFKNTSTLGYLTVTQAVADFATLIQSLKANLTAHAAPVLVFGGSYGGMLAAWMRMKYPHIVMGAVASSAPILGFYGLTDPYAFYDVVANDFKSESQHCYDVLKSSWSKMDEALATDQGRALLNSKFKMCPGTGVDYVPGLLENALVYVAMADYPAPSNFLTHLPAYPVREICKVVDHPTSGNDSFSWLKDVMEIYYNYTGGLHCYGGEQDDDPFGMFDGWNFQASTEMIMMTAGISNNSIFPPVPFNFTDDLAGCRQNTGLPPRPYWLVTEFGGFDIGNVLRRSSSNILLFNGLRDPWSSSGVLKSISDSIIALVEPEGAHHVDLRFSTKEDPDWLQQVRIKETRIIASWLRQYYKDEAIVASSPMSM